MAKSPRSLATSSARSSSSLQREYRTEEDPTTRTLPPRSAKQHAWHCRSARNALSACVPDRRPPRGTFQLVLLRALPRDGTVASCLNTKSSW